MVACNYFIKFWSIATLVLLSVNKVEPKGTTSAQRKTNSDENIQNSIQSDDHKKKDVEIKVEKKGCTDVTFEYSNEIEAANSYKNEANRSLLLIDSLDVEKVATNLYWNFLCVSLQTSGFKDYFEFLAHLSYLAEKERDPEEIVKNESDEGLIGEAEFKSISTIRTNTEKYYPDKCDSKEIEWNYVYSKYMKISYYIMNIIKSIAILNENNFWREQYLLRRLFPLFVHQFTPLVTIHSGGDWFQHNLKVFRFLDDLIMHWTYSLRKVEGIASKDVLHTSKIVQCAFENTLNSLQKLANFDFRHSSIKSVSPVVKSMRIMAQAMQNLYEIYKVDGNYKLLNTSSFLQKEPLGLEELFQKGIERESQINLKENSKKVLELCSTTVKLMKDIASNISESSQISSDSKKITSFFLTEITHKMYKCFYDYVFDNENEERSLQDLQNLANRVTRFRKENPLNSEVKNKTTTTTTTTLFTSKILEMFKTPNNQKAVIKSVINTSKIIAKSSNVLRNILHLLLVKYEWQSSDSFKKMYDSVQLFTEASDNFLQLFKNDESLVNTKEKIVKERFFKIYKIFQACINNELDLLTFERFDFYFQVLQFVNVINDISVEIVDMLEELSVTYDDSIAEKIKLFVNILSNTTNSLFSFFKVVSNNKQATDIDRGAAKLAITNFINTERRVERNYIRKYVLKFCREMAKQSKQLHSIHFSNSPKSNLKIFQSLFLATALLKNEIILSRMLLVYFYHFLTFREFLNHCYIRNIFNEMEHLDYMKNALDASNNYNSKKHSIAEKQKLKEFTSQVADTVLVAEQFIYKAKRKILSCLKHENLQFQDTYLKFLSALMEDLKDSLQKIEAKGYLIDKTDQDDFAFINTTMRKLNDHYE